MRRGSDQAFGGSLGVVIRGCSAAGAKGGVAVTADFLSQRPARRSLQHTARQPAPCRVFEALEEYKVLLNQPDEKIDMLMGAALIAQHRYPLLVRPALFCLVCSTSIGRCSLGTYLRNH